MPPAFEFARCRRRAPHWLAGQAIGSGSKREIDDINPHTWLTQRPDHVAYFKARNCCVRPLQLDAQETNVVTLHQFSDVCPVFSNRADSRPKKR
jgi:hypothetical protein